MIQTAIPFVFMRGGTSRGPYFKRSDLPGDPDLLADVLLAAIGAGHPLNIDGIGGGNAVTTKVAMLSKSSDAWADIDYFFCQVSVLDKTVDFKPSCGNILAGVGPAAIEMGLIPTQGDRTEVKILATNTGSRVVATVETSGGKIRYDGNTAIDGVPGTAAPITLKFMDVTGSVTGEFLPTGSLRDEIDGVEVTCMDVAMPMVIARAVDFGLTGYETREQLDENRAFFARLEEIRVLAGERMGLGDVTKSVTPKFGILAPPRNGGTVTTRYFMPWTTHPTMAVTGAQCLASCVLTPGTIADELALDRPPSGAPVILEHAAGTIQVVVDYNIQDGFKLGSAGLVRTARKLAQGSLFIPGSIWSGRQDD